MAKKTRKFKDKHTYTDYLRVAERHLKVCKLMLEKANTLENHDVQCILYEIYYIVGYIIEGAFIYSIYSWYEYGEDDKVQDNTDYYMREELGLTFGHEDWTVHQIDKHNIKDLKSILLEDEEFSQYYGNYPYVTQSENDDKRKEIVDLINNWSTEIRYKSIENPEHRLNINKENIGRLVEYCDEIVVYSSKIVKC